MSSKSAKEEGGAPETAYGAPRTGRPPVKLEKSQDKRVRALFPADGELDQFADMDPQKVQRMLRATYNRAVSQLATRLTSNETSPTELCSIVRALKPGGKGGSGVGEKAGDGRTKADLVARIQRQLSGGGAELTEAPGLVEGGA